MINEDAAYADDIQKARKLAEAKKAEAYKQMSNSITEASSRHDEITATMQKDLDKINELIKKEREQRIDQSRIAAINKATEEARTKHDQEHGAEDQKQQEALKQMAHELFNGGKDGEE